MLVATGKGAIVKVEPVEVDKDKDACGTFEKTEDATTKVLLTEKIDQAKQCEKRNKIFEDIIANVSDENPASKLMILFGLLSVLGSAITTFFYTLIPTHHVFGSPEYWYELPLQGLFVFIPIWSAYIIYLCSFYMNIKIIMTKKVFIKIWLTTGVTMFIAFFASYHLWVHVLQYNYPVPLTGYLTFLSSTMISSLIVLWKSFPLDWRRNQSFRNRLKWFMYSFLFQQFTTIEYGIVTSILLGVPRNYQWVVAIFLPLVREFNIWMISKLLSKAHAGDMTGAMIALNQTMIIAMRWLWQLQLDRLQPRPPQRL